MEDKEQKNQGEETIPEEMRFKYIGFDIYPSRVKEFWKSEEEKRKYLEEIRRKESTSPLTKRDHSLVRVTVFSKVDKLILTVTSALLTVSLFLPWFSLRGEGFNSQLIGLGFLFKLGMLFNYAPLSGTLFGVFVILLVLTILSSFGAGVVSLVSIYKKHNDMDTYLVSLKKNLKWNLIPLVLWVGLIIISIIGLPTPFADVVKVRGFGDSFNVINFFALSSYGIWLSLPSLIINCVKINDL